MDMISLDDAVGISKSSEHVGLTAPPIRGGGSRDHLLDARDY